jgi:hypothetical protein
MPPIGRPPSCECGICPKCKRAAYQRAWYARQSPEKRRAIVEARDPKAVLRAERRRWGTERRRASLRASSARQYVKAAGKAAARYAVSNAVRDGRLVKGPCQECGTWLVQAHHHKGYEREYWLDVVWLCVRHHKAVHGHLRVVA